ncbi:hypothetical protein BC832DRAFT_288215 [Gaertneriomyces semiglobifer]|nr:hypothetical protein BC832DRAFT_288215 [Gaertneriomyces semiglobifer]
MLVLLLLSTLLTKFFTSAKTTCPCLGSSTIYVSPFSHQAFDLPRAIRTAKTAPSVYSYTFAFASDDLITITVLDADGERIYQKTGTCIMNTADTAGGRVQVRCRNMIMQCKVVYDLQATSHAKDSFRDEHAPAGQRTLTQPPTAYWRRRKHPGRSSGPADHLPNQHEENRKPNNKTYQGAARTIRPHRYRSRTQAST